MRQFLFRLVGAAFIVGAIGCCGSLALLAHKGKPLEGTWYSVSDSDEVYHFDKSGDFWVGLPQIEEFGTWRSIDRTHNRGTLIMRYDNDNYPVSQLGAPIYGDWQLSPDGKFIQITRSGVVVFRGRKMKTNSH